MIHRLQARRGWSGGGSAWRSGSWVGQALSVGRLGAHPAVGLSAQGGRDGTEFERRQNENSR